MTRKERILRMVQRLPDGVSYDEVMHRLESMKDIEIGLEQIERGEVIDHDELFAELLAEDAKDSDRLESAGEKEPASDPKLHRPRRPADGGGVREAAPERGRKTKKVP